MSEEKILKTLMSLGLAETEAAIYILLAKEGSKRGRNIAEELRLYKQQLYRSLKRLQNKGVVSASLERPAVFSALPFEKVLNILIEAKKEQTLTLQASRKELLSTWRSLVEKGSGNS